MKDALLEKLASLADLPQGWHFGEGIAARPKAVAVAKEIYRKLDKPNATDVFPGMDGSLALVFYFGNRCVEISISPTGRLDLAVEEGMGFGYREVVTKSDSSLEEAVEQVEEEYSDFLDRIEANNPELQAAIDSALEQVYQERNKAVPVTADTVLETLEGLEDSQSPPS